MNRFTALDVAEMQQVEGGGIFGKIKNFGKKVWAKVKPHLPKLVGGLLTMLLTRK